jgi:hypothetical protein
MQVPKVLELMIQQALLCGESRNHWLIQLNGPSAMKIRPATWAGRRAGSHVSVSQGTIHIVFSESVTVMFRNSDPGWSLYVTWGRLHRSRQASFQIMRYAHETMIFDVLEVWEREEGEVAIIAVSADRDGGGHLELILTTETDGLLHLFLLPYFPNRKIDSW